MESAVNPSYQSGPGGLPQHQQSEKRREDLANTQIALEERRMVDERQFRRDEAARRERQDAAQHEKRQAPLRVLEAMKRKQG